jgi:hypothetical protein
MELRTKIVHDGTRNASVQITGRAPCSWSVIVDASELDPVPRDLRIDAVYYIIADKTDVTLGWGKHDADPLPLLPLGGRGRIDFGEVSGLHNTAINPNGDIVLQSFGEGLFTIVLDLSKHIGS